MESSNWTGIIDLHIITYQGYHDNVDSLEANLRM